MRVTKWRLSHLRHRDSIVLQFATLHCSRAVCAHLFWAAVKVQFATSHLKVFTEAVSEAEAVTLFATPFAAPKASPGAPRSDCDTRTVCSWRVCVVMNVIERRVDRLSFRAAREGRGLPRRLRPTVLAGNETPEATLPWSAA